MRSILSQRKSLFQAVAFRHIFLNSFSSKPPIIKYPYTNEFFDVKVFPALKRYKELHGHLLIPQRYVIMPLFGDEEKNWPEVLWDLKLGMVVKKIRIEYRANGCHGSIRPEHLQQLNELGFAWHHADKKFELFFVRNLQIFKELYGHINVPANFSIPSVDPWPKYCTGYKLGNVIAIIRNQNCYKPQLEKFEKQLNEIGFSSNIKEATWDGKILPALENYYRIYDNCNINVKFVVPESEHWDSALWGLKLGNVVNNIRSRGDYQLFVERDADRLEQINFQLELTRSEVKWTKEILPALVKYYAIYGHTKIPRSFVVPEKDDKWQSHLSNLKLGHTVYNIRKLGTYHRCIKRDTEKLEVINFFNENS